MLMGAALTCTPVTVLAVVLCRAVTHYTRCSAGVLPRSEQAGTLTAYGECSWSGSSQPSTTYGKGDAQDLNPELSVPSTWHSCCCSCCIM